MRRERHDEHELGVGLARKAEQHVVRLDLAAHGARRAGGGRNVPHVLARKKDLGVGDVIGLIDLDLDVEQVDRDADVRAQAGGHRVDGLEELGERALVRLDDRVLRIDHIEVDGSLVRVDHDLDRVADVVDVVVVEGRRLRVGVGCAGRVGIDHPVQAAVDHDDVRIAVERQEHWRLAVRTHLVQAATLRAGQYLALVGTFHFVAEAKA